nr:MAG TPA: hypothetical protein [Caudoviricetes sp.]
MAFEPLLKVFWSEKSLSNFPQVFFIFTLGNSFNPIIWS